MDVNDPIFPTRALRLPHTSPATLRRRMVGMHAVEFVDADVLQGLAFGTDVTVLLRNVGKLLDSVQITGWRWTFFHADVRRNSAIVEPLQQFAISVGVVGRQTLW